VVLVVERWWSGWRDVVTGAPPRRRAVTAALI
jgi:hypothetical protein